MIFFFIGFGISDINLLNLLSGDLKQKSNLCTHHENTPLCPVAVFCLSL